MASYAADRGFCGIDILYFFLKCYASEWLYVGVHGHEQHYPDDRNESFGILPFCDHNIFEARWRPFRVD